MEKLAIIIGSIINPVILILFFVTLGGLLYTLFDTKNINRKIDSDKKKHGGRKEYTPGGIRKDGDVYYWEDTLAYIELFNKTQQRYIIFEQLIPVFPLLGILGTVAGLIQQLDDIEQMRSALAMSMSTTFWGLIAAIILKCFDAAVNSEVNKMNMRFETDELNYQMVKDKFDKENEDRG